MSLIITPEQRDAMYDQILDRLSGIGDIEIAIESERYDVAERLGREYSDDLRLLVDDLGLGEGGGDSVELSLPPEVLRRVLLRLRELAEGHSVSQQPELVEVQAAIERDRLVAQACTNLLADLDGVEATGR